MEWISNSNYVVSETGIPENLGSCLLFSSLLCFGEWCPFWYQTKVSRYFWYATHTAIVDMTRRCVLGGLKFPTPALNNVDNREMYLMWCFSSNPDCDSRCFSNNSVCSLVLKYGCFLKLPCQSGFSLWDEIIFMRIWVIFALDQRWSNHLPSWVVISCHLTIPCLSLWKTLSSSFPFSYRMIFDQCILLSVFHLCGRFCYYCLRLNLSLMKVLVLVTESFLSFSFQITLFACISVSFPFLCFNFKYQTLICGQAWTLNFCWQSYFDYGYD